MVVAFAAFAFTDSMENGGVGVLLGLHRIVAAKIAQKAQNAYRRLRVHGRGDPPAARGKARRAGRGDVVVM